MHKLTAKAQFRVLPSKKGIRLNKENLTVLSNQATVAFPERAEKNQHVANAKGATRWLKHPKNPTIFQLRNLPK